MQEKTLSFEQMPELIQNLVERIEALEKTVREKQQPQPLEGELMSVEDVCKLLGKSKSAVYRTVRCHDIPFIRLFNLNLIHQPSSLSSISVSPRVGSHKLLELLHVGNALDILFLLEPLLDRWPVEVQSVTLADKRNVVTPHRSVHRRFGFTK